MKKILLALTVVSFLAFIGCATTQQSIDTSIDESEEEKISPDKYTYDGEYDRATFLEWIVLPGGMKVCENHVHLWMENPDKTSSVKMIEGIFITTDGQDVVLYGYRYFKDSVEYMFALDSSGHHYEQLMPNQGEAT